jgi:hypothetical protein
VSCSASPPRRSTSLPTGERVRASSRKRCQLQEEVASFSVALSPTFVIALFSFGLLIIL